MLGMSSRGVGGADVARRIKSWAREVFDPEGGATILVSELACSEPGCPPIETVIAILRGPQAHEKYKIHRPSAEITRADIVALAPTAIGSSAS
jgi:hypothetical protein